MDRDLLHKLIDAIVAEVLRRVAALERQKQHPEQVLVLLAAPVAYPAELLMFTHRLLPAIVLCPGEIRSGRRIVSRRRQRLIPKLRRLSSTALPQLKTPF